MIFVATSAVYCGSEWTTGGIETLADGYGFTEGPLWLPTGGLIFSDIPGNTIYRQDQTVFRKPSGKSNGLTLDREGRLVVCEHRNRRVTRTEPDGSITVLADQYRGTPLNSPNDVVVRSDGSIYFTDPPFGLLYFDKPREQELPFCGVYLIRPSGELLLLFKGFDRPNGLAFSPDESALYISDDKDDGSIHAFAVLEDGTLGESRLLSQVSEPDGLKVDRQGNIWCAAGEGVLIFSPDGILLETIKFPRKPANLAFGGKDSKSLFVTARASVYHFRCHVEGIHPSSKFSLAKKQ